MEPVTELPNEMTLDIDLADPVEFVQLLGQADSQIFAGWHAHPGAEAKRG